MAESTATYNRLSGLHLTPLQLATYPAHDVIRAGLVNYQLGTQILPDELPQWPCDLLDTVVALAMHKLKLTAPDADDDNDRDD